MYLFGSFQLLSHVRLFATPWTAACQVSLYITNSQSLLKLMSTESVMPSYHLILCNLLLLPSIFPSIRVFSNELALCLMWPKSWSFYISPSNEYSVLISFRIDWFDLVILISLSEIFVLLIWFWNSGTFIGHLTLCIVSCPWEKCFMGIAQLAERVLKTVTNAFVLYVIFLCRVLS